MERLKSPLLGKKYSVGQVNERVQKAIVLVRSLHIMLVKSNGKLTTEWINLNLSWQRAVDRLSESDSKIYGYLVDNTIPDAKTPFICQ